MSQLSPDPEPNRSKTVRNERIKLAAGLLNTLSSASIVVGGITPIAAVAFGVPAGPTRAPLAGLVIATAFIAVGGGLHWVAQKLLGAGMTDLLYALTGPLLIALAGAAVYFIARREARAVK